MPSDALTHGVKGFKRVQVEPRDIVVAVTVPTMKRGIKVEKEEGVAIKQEGAIAIKQEGVAIKEEGAIAQTGRKAKRQRLKQEEAAGERESVSPKFASLVRPSEAECRAVHAALSTLHPEVVEGLKKPAEGGCGSREKVLDALVGTSTRPSPCPSPQPCTLLPRMHAHAGAY